jgi:hypothetical protein
MHVQPSMPPGDGGVAPTNEYTSAPTAAFRETPPSADA